MRCSRSNGFTCARYWLNAWLRPSLSTQKNMTNELMDFGRYGAAERLPVARKVLSLRDLLISSTLPALSAEL